MRSESSSTEMPFSSSIQSSVETLVATSPDPRFHRATARRPRSFSSSEVSALAVGGSSAGGCVRLLAAAPPPRRARPAAARPRRRAPLRRRAPPRRPARPRCSSASSASGSSAASARLVGGLLLGLAGRAPRPAARRSTRPCSAIWPSGDREAGDHRAEAADQAGDRARGEADELAAQDVEAGQPGDHREALGVERRAVHDPALVLELVVLLGEVGDRLRGDHRVAVDQGQRGRADQQLVDLLGAGVGGGALREPVLDHLEHGVGLAQLAAQLGGLGDADPAVVDGEDRLGALEALGELGDRCFLLRSVHLKSFVRVCAARRNEKSLRAGRLDKRGLSNSPAPVFRATPGGPADGLGRLDGRG